MAKPVLVGVLGPLEVQRGTRDVTPSGTRERILLTLLALHAGTVVPTPTILEVVWGDEPPRSGSKAVTSLASRLRAALGRGKNVVIGRDGGYVLDVPAEDVDAARFAGLVERARAAMEDLEPAQAAELLEEALGLWRDETGPAELGDTPAARALVAALVEARAQAAEDRAEAELALGRHGALIEQLERTVAGQPQRERSWSHLMLALHRSGRSTEALAAFDRARAALADAFGLDPSPELRELAERIRAGDLSLAPPPLAEPDALVELPPEADTFVGREAELDALAHLLDKPGAVTLAGPPGTGKSRLALRIARDAAPSFPGGVHVCVLEGLRADREVPPAVAGILGSAGSDAASIAAGLDGARALVVLDGADDVPGGAGALVEALLARCPAVTVLTTAPAALGVPGEHVERLEPLPVGIGGPNDSSRLFGERARAVGAPEAAERAVNDLCARVGGVPLAIEIAAAWADGLDPAEIVRRLDERAPQAVEIGIEDLLGWVFDRLSSAEQRALTRAAVFTGPFTLEAAARVAGERIAPALGSLARRGLVARRDERYVLPRAIRRFARARLAEAAEEELARRLHGETMVAIATELGAAIGTADEQEAMGLIAAWMDDLRAAFRSAMSARDAGSALGLVDALRWFTFFRRSAEGYGWAREAGAAFERIEHPLLARALATAAIGQAAAGAHAAARAALAAAESAALRAGTPEEDLLFARAVVAVAAGDPGGALPLIERAIDGEDEVAARYWRGARVEVLLDVGRADEAARAMNSYRLAATRLASPSLRAIALWSFARATEPADPAAAAAMRREAVASARAGGCLLIPAA